MAVVFNHGKCIRATGNARSVEQTLPNFLSIQTQADWINWIAATVTAKERQRRSEGSAVTSTRNWLLRKFNPGFRRGWIILKSFWS